MAKSAHQDVLQNGLQFVKDNADKYYACSAEPTTYVEATSTYALALENVGSIDFTWGTGATGEELTVAAKSGISIDADGSLTHVALVDSINSKLLIVDTTSSQQLYAGNQLNLPSWKMISKNPV
jgi:hypothetical protein